MNAFHAKKRFGQHLLRYPDDARRIARLLLEESDCRDGNVPPQTVFEKTIVEIGPGTGGLTSALVELYPSAEIIAVEFDRDLLKLLENRFADNSSVRFIQEDILKVELAKFGAEVFVIGNLPYNLSAPIMQWTLSQRSCVSKAVYMLQREVARRICSQPSSKDWSPLAIQTQLRFKVSQAFDLAPERFTPPPKVHSSVFSLNPRQTSEDFPDFDENTSVKFEKLVRNAFESRRKTLLNNLMGKYRFSRSEVVEMLFALGLTEKIRAEQLSIKDFIKLLQAFDAS